MSILSTAKMYLKRPAKQAAPSDLYDHTVKLLDGSELDLNSLRGHPTLVVNTASKCGFTPQYEGLQNLYESYRDQGLQILGSPSKDFADQELDSAEEIGAFCQKNYGVTFPLTETTSVRANPDALWQDINSQPNSAPPNWNFTKFLIGADGKLIKRFGTKVKPEDPEVVAAIQSALEA
jgi:glutathione peroxidase